MTFVEQEGLFNIISWVRNGLAIKVHDRKGLVQLLPRFFSQSLGLGLRNRPAGAFLVAHQWLSCTRLPGGPFALL